MEFMVTVAIEGPSGKRGQVFFLIISKGQRSTKINLLAINFSVFAGLSVECSLHASHVL